MITITIDGSKITIIFSPEMVEKIKEFISKKYKVPKSVIPDIPLVLEIDLKELT